MSRHAALQFPREVQERLQYYVYRLIDPRTGETFYVGKGKGDRVFSHVRGSIEDDSLSEKITRIHEIRNAGLDVGHVVHRHGMDEATALEVEAALIDAYPGAVNVAGGHGSGDVGVAHSKEIIERYSAETAEFQHKALLINVSNSARQSSVYEAVRFAWRLDARKASDADVVLAINNGLIIGAFIADHWLEARSENFPGRETIEDRYGFVGRTAPEELDQLYVRKRVPDQYRKRGAANPVRYTW